VADYFPFLAVVLALKSAILILTCKARQ